MSENANNHPAIVDTSDIADVSTSSLAPDAEAAIRFLQWLAPKGPWLVYAIHGERGGAPVPSPLDFGPNALSQVRGWINVKNRDGFNIYYMANRATDGFRGKAKKGDIQEATFAYVDIDPVEGRELTGEQIRIERLLTDGRPVEVPAPSAIVFSGGGYQALHRLSESFAIGGDEKRAAEYESYNRGLADALMADSCHSCEHLLRLPGTINWPNEKKRKKGRMPTLARVVGELTDVATQLDRLPKAVEQTHPVAATSAKSAIDSNASERSISSIAELDRWNVAERVKAIVAVGRVPGERKDKDDSRSAWLFDGVCNLLRHEVPAEIILGIILDARWPISESVLDKKSGARKYALRQIESAAAEIARDPIVLNAKDPLRSARVFVERCRPNLLHINDEWLDYSSGAYLDVELNTLKADLYEFLEKAKGGQDRAGNPLPFQPNKTKVDHVIDALKGATHRPRARHEPPLWLGGEGPNPKQIVACRNGLLHLPSGNLMPATPNFFTRNALDFDIDLAASEPVEWLKFLEQVWGGGPEIDLLQEIIGYLLVPDTSLQKIFLLVGPKRSGKGTIASILTALIGNRNTCNPSPNGMSNDHGLAPLIGKQLAIISDMRMGFKTDSAKVAEDFLRISGEDSVTINRKYLSHWTGRLSVRFVIMSNEIPRLPDASGALASRFVPLLMDHSFYGKEDPTLADRLVSELPGILNWAVAGWRRLQVRGHFILPSRSIGAISDIEDQGSPLVVFLRDVCVLDAQAVTPKDDLFNAYIAWAKRNNEAATGARQFFKNLKAITNNSVSETRPTVEGQRVQCCLGIKLQKSEVLSPEFDIL